MERKKVHIFIDFIWSHVDLRGKPVACEERKKALDWEVEASLVGLSSVNLLCTPATAILSCFLFVRYGCWPCSSLSFQDSTPRTTEKVPLKGGKSSDLGWIIHMPSQDAVPAYLQEMPWLSAIGVGRMEVGAGWADASDLSG